MTNKDHDSNIFVGTSGWTYDDWDGAFYPKGVSGAERLSYYAERFDTVEVNATFYRFPAPNMIKSWNTRLGENFHLLLKGHRRITHYRKLKDVEDTLGGFLDRAGQLERLVALLWQLPPSLHRDLDRLEAFVKLLPAEVRHAVEFRHPSWWDDGAFEVLERHDIASVAISHPSLPADLRPTTDLIYLRFHGLGEELYRYHYSDEELAEWVDTLLPHLEGRRLYAFFNNDYDAKAVGNAQTFRRMLEERGSRSGNT